MGMKSIYGYTGQSIETRCKEHTWHLHLHCLEKSEIMEHSAECGHRFKFQDTEVIAKMSGYVNQLVKELIAGDISQK